MGVKVENKFAKKHMSPEESERAFKGMMAAFKRAVNEAGVLAEYNKHLAFETESQKLRRKKRESEFNRKKEENLKKKWREHFGN